MKHQACRRRGLVFRVLSCCGVFLLVGAMTASAQQVFKIQPESVEGEPGVGLRWQSNPTDHYRLLTRP